MLRLISKLLNKDKKLKTFYDNIVNDIKNLDSKQDKSKKENVEDFVKEIRKLDLSHILVVRENDENESIDKANLTIEEKLELLQMKNKTLKNLSNTKHAHPSYSWLKVKSSLAFTEDEIDERIECAKKELIRLYEEKSNENDFEVGISPSEMNESFSYYLNNAYLRGPFKEMLKSCTEQDENNNWIMKS